MCCDCDCGCDCDCSPGFTRKVYTKRERLEWLQSYLEQLKAETAAVQEEIGLLKKK